MSIAIVIAQVSGHYNIQPPSQCNIYPKHACIIYIFELKKKCLKYFYLIPKNKRAGGWEKNTAAPKSCFQKVSASTRQPHNCAGEKSNDFSIWNNYHGWTT